MAETREIVVPGDVVGSTESLSPGQNTYLDGSSIRALRLGVRSVRGDRVNVIGLNGRYEPQRGDMVIGTAVELGPSNWYIDIGAANDVGMHVNDVPWRVEFGETSKFIDIGETVLLKIVHVDEMKKAQVSMKDRQCRKLTGGLIWEVSPSKVPRIVGRNGSMISLLKDYTNVRIFVGQNGAVWLDGEPADVALALEALEKIEAEAHTTGLTDRMKAWLEERRPGAAQRKREAAEEGEQEEEEFRPRTERRPRPPVERAEEDEEFGERERPRREERGERGERRMGRHSERRAHHGEPHHGRAQMRERSRGEDDRPRREERRGRDERPRRFDDEERPARRPRFDDEEERPARRPRFDEEAERPARRSRAEDEERPARRPRFDDEEERPARRPRFDDEERPARRPRFDDEERPARRPRFDDEEERPARRARDDDEERPRRDDGDSSGGGRRRRGGRGRGRGGRDRSD